MWVLTITALCVGLAGGAWGGWRAGRFLLNKKMMEENTFLRQHATDLRITLDYWKEQSAYNREIHNTTIQHHNTNLKETLFLILTLLQNQNKENLKEDEKEKVENIIKTIKGIK